MNFNISAINQAQESMDDMNISGNVEIYFIYRLDSQVEPTFVLTKDDVQKELIKAEARLSLLDAYQQTTVPPLGETEIVKDSIKHRLYDMAWLIIRFVLCNQFTYLLGLAYLILTQMNCSQI